MPVHLRAALPDDAAACVRLRGKTRENAVSEARLRAYGITAASWARDIETGVLPGWVALDDGGDMIGMGFGDTRSGEVVVLALHPAHEGAGLGRRLLSQVVDDLRRRGHTRVFLGCSTDAGVRSHGFYRHLGWRSTGRLDERGDKVLEWHAPEGGSPVADDTTPPRTEHR